MDYKVIFTPQSLDDLKDIIIFIAEDAPERARTFGHILIDRALSLENFPERGRIVPEMNISSVREIIHGAYRIIYEIKAEPDAVYVLRFWHAAKGKPEFTMEN